MDLLQDRHVEATFAVLGFITLALSFRRSQVQTGQRSRSEPRHQEKENSSYQTYVTAHRTYPSIRTFVRGVRQDGHDAGSGGTLPIIVFIHGVGGSLAQFGPIIKSLGTSAPCFGIDFPGCGLSEFSPTAWDAYTQEALTELVRVALLRNHPDGNRGIVVVGHSMGCRIALSLAQHSSRGGTDPTGRKWPKVLGVTAICPEDSTYSLMRGLTAATFLALPDPMIDILRALDRRGGIHSHSVARFAGRNADAKTRELQLRFNEQSRTSVFRRVAWGVVRGWTQGASSWASLDSSIHLLFIAGKDDLVTPPAALERIEQAVEATKQHRHVKFKILKGGHALPYDTTNSHGVAALIRTFLEEIDEHLSTSWQLQHSDAGGKWDVKNLAKWRTVIPVSPAIGRPRPVFRAMKTLRGIDDTHNPEDFARAWERQIKAVVDISQDEPVYDPAGFGPRSIEYIKFATVSKIPPSKHQVEDFIELIDRVRAKTVSGWSGDEQEGIDRTIGVHCHYGWNRTGFFICSYLVERCGYTIEEALEEFRDAKPPGIKHEHFVDELYLRYASRYTVDDSRRGSLAESANEVREEPAEEPADDTSRGPDESNTSQYSAEGGTSQSYEVVGEESYEVRKSESFTSSYSTYDEARQMTYGSQHYGSEEVSGEEEQDDTSSRNGFDVEGSSLFG